MFLGLRGLRAAIAHLKLLHVAGDLLVDHLLRVHLAAALSRGGRLPIVLAGQDHVLPPELVLGDGLTELVGECENYYNTCALDSIVNDISYTDATRISDIIGILIFSFSLPIVIAFARVLALHLFAVVDAALFRVLEHRVGLLDFEELIVGDGADIGVAHFGEVEVALFNFVLRGGGLHFEHLVQTQQISRLECSQHNQIKAY